MNKTVNQDGERFSAMCSADKLAQNLIRSRNLWI